MAKGLTLKVKKFLGLISTFVEVIGETMVGGLFATPLLIYVKWLSDKDRSCLNMIRIHVADYAKRLFGMLCAIRYHLHDLKNVKSTHGGVLFLLKLQTSLRLKF